MFALGTVLYEITTGQRPFVGEHDPQIMTAIVMGNFLPPHSIVHGYPLELERIVMRALANEAQDRFASAQDMQRALEGWLAASGPPVLQGHVALLVRERCGDEVNSRARALHEAMSGARGPASAADTSSGGMELSRKTAPPRGRSAMPLVAAVLVGSALGLGVLGWVWATRKPKVAAMQPAMSASAAPSAAAPTSTTPATAPAPAATGNGVLRIKVDPPTALLIVDGVVMPRGVDRVARPGDGGTIQVVVRAEGHEDTIVIVDEATTDEVEVALLPLTPQRPHKPRVRDARGDAGAARPATSASSAAPEEAPPNPYE